VIKKILKGTGLLLLLMLLVVVGIAAWVAGTETGLRQALALGNKFAPGSLEWDQADGKLIGPLALRGLRYSQENSIEASIGTIDFDWNPASLSRADLIINQLHIDDVTVRLPANEEPQKPSADTDVDLPDISLPLSLRLEDIDLTNLAIYLPEQDSPVIIEQLALSANVEQSDIQLTNLEIQAPQGSLQLAGNLASRDDYPMDLALDWQADIGQSEPIQGGGTFTGSLARLEIEHQTSGFAIADIQATISDVLAAPAWDAQLKANLPRAELVSPLLTASPELALQSSGSLDQYQATATVNAQTSETGPLSLNADVSGNTEMLDIQSLLLQFSDGEGELSVRGQVTFAAMQADITGQWRSLGWPLRNEPQISSAQGSFDMQGSADDYTASLTTDLDGELIPSGVWAVAVAGSTKALSDLSIKGQTLGGSIAASGTADWENQPSWDIDLVTENINPAEQWNEFPGSVDLQLSSSGQINDNGPVLLASIEQLSGSLRDQPLSGSGRLQLDGKALTVEGLNLIHGPSRVDVDGIADDQLALDFSISSPDLSTAIPGVSGAISITGNVSGSKEAPAIRASGSAGKIAQSSGGVVLNSVGALEFAIDGMLAEDRVSSLSLSASDIASGGQQIQTINIDGRGSQANHGLVLSASSDQGDVDIELTGGYRDNTWSGALASIQLANTPAGDWRLRNPVNISANAENADVGKLCLDNSDQLGSLCVIGRWALDGATRAIVDINDLSPELASLYLPPEVQINTRLNGEATAVVAADGNIVAAAALSVAPGNVILDSAASTVEIGLERISVDATVQGKDASVAMVASIAELGELNARASVSDLAGEGKLAGNLSMDFPDLTLLSDFVPQIQQISGALDSDLRFGGTLQRPQIEGELALVDFAAEIPETAMFIEDTQLTVNGKADGTLLISGESYSGDGKLDIDGNVNPATRALSFTINGDNYEVANTALIQAVVSPRMTIDMDNTGMQVNGEVSVPRVYINANGGNEGIKTVSASSDVVFVSEDDEMVEEEVAPASEISVDVKLILGDSVEIEAGDFRGRLEGDLRVQQTPEIAPLGTGTINVVNGDYVIYGQQLNMERGRILFGGGPVDNPTLDMEVAREVAEYDVVAGARIQGTAQSPRLELYSEPSMPDASILSFILLGQPPGAGASYTLGKYLTPDLYVSYGIGLFDAINTFNMRYSITDKLSVEAASGSGSSADIIYTIER